MDPDDRREMEAIATHLVRMVLSGTVTPDEAFWWTRSVAEAARPWRPKEESVTVRTIAGVVLALGLLVSQAHAQTTATPINMLEWDQPVSATTPITAYTHWYRIDSGTTWTQLPRTCTTPPAPAPAVCRASIPAMTPGTHTIQVQSRAQVGTAVVTAPANPAQDTITLSYVVVAGPQGLRVVTP